MALECYDGGKHCTGKRMQLARAESEKLLGHLLDRCLREGLQGPSNFSVSMLWQ